MPVPESLTVLSLASDMWLNSSLLGTAVAVHGTMIPPGIATTKLYSSILLRDRHLAERGSTD